MDQCDQMFAVLYTELEDFPVKSRSGGKFCPWYYCSLFALLSLCCMDLKSFEVLVVELQRKHLQTIAKLRQIIKICQTFKHRPSWDLVALCWLHQGCKFLEIDVVLSIYISHTCQFHKLYPYIYIKTMLLVQLPLIDSLAIFKRFTLQLVCEEMTG